MRTARFRWRWLAGAAAALSFLVLLLIRLDVFAPGTLAPRTLGVAQREAFAGRETWMNILQNGKKIGYAHRRIQSGPQGYRFDESLVMRLQTMGVVQDLRVRTTGELLPDASLAGFATDLSSPLFSFSARGEVKGRKIHLRMGTPGEEKTMVVSLDRKPYLSNGLLESVWLSGMKPGDAKTFHVFDPSVLGQRPVRVAVLSDEEIVIMGDRRPSRKVEIEFAGVRQLAWIGAEGDVLRAEGFLGITLVQANPREAVSGMGAAGADLTEAVSLPANREIPKPEALRRIRFRLHGVDAAHFSLHGGRQTYREGVLSVARETWPPVAEKPAEASPVPPAALRPGPFIESDHPLIRKKAREIVDARGSAADNARRIVAWVQRNIEKKPVLSVPGAVDTLVRRSGDCNEHAVLLAALARAAGIPAQVEAGLVYQRGRFYYHAWNVLYLGRWITADAVFGQMPADVTHIRLVRGDAEAQLDLVRAIGVMKLEILDTEEGP